MTLASMHAVQCLQPGVRVAFEGGLTAAHRLTIADGVADVSCVATRSGRYQNRTFAPRSSWRAPVLSELDMLLARAHEDSPPAGRVCVVRAPPPVLDVIPSLREAADAHQFQNAPCLELLGQRVESWLKSAFSATRLQLVGPWQGMCDLRTTTKDNEEFVGLHVDNWEKAPVESRQLCKARLCINAGLDDRFFVFINRPIHRMKDDLGLEHQGNACELGEAFLMHFQDYPVVSIRLHPGDAYIAPTENIVHDGSTRGSSNPDVIYSVLGDFVVCEQSGLP